MKILTFKRNKTSDFANSKRYAFALAEVLITLGVIGIVAAMTLPALVQNNKNKEILSGLKKSYAELENIARSISYEYGEGLYTALDNANDSEEFMELFAKYYSGIKRCENNICVYSAKPIYRTYTDKVVDSSSETYFGKNQFITKDGRMISFSKNVYGKFITIDVNGFEKSPNAWGRDVFTFIIKEDNKVHPCGGPIICSNIYNFNCNASEPPTANYAGVGCTYYALTKPKFLNKKYYYENYTGEL